MQGLGNLRTSAETDGIHQSSSQDIDRIAYGLGSYSGRLEKDYYGLSLYSPYKFKK